MAGRHDSYAAKAAGDPVIPADELRRDVERVSRALEVALPGGAPVSGQVHVGRLPSGFQAYTDLESRSISLSPATAAGLHRIFAGHEPGPDRPDPARGRTGHDSRSAVQAVTHELVHLRPEAGSHDGRTAGHPGLLDLEESVAELVAASVTDRVIRALPLSTDVRQGLLTAPRTLAYPNGALGLHGLLRTITTPAGAASGPAQLSARRYADLLTSLASTPTADKPARLTDAVLQWSAVREPDAATGERTASALLAVAAAWGERDLFGGAPDGRDPKPGIDRGVRAAHDLREVAVGSADRLRTAYAGLASAPGAAAGTPAGDRAAALAPREHQHACDPDGGITR